MTQVFLIDEDTIKSNSAINDNLWNKYLVPSIREAQDINLQQILGSCLYKTILTMVDEETIGTEENAAYKYLLDNFIQMFLLYQVEANAIPIINIKNGNIGSVISTDEYVQSISQGNADLLVHYFQDRADFYARRMQEYILGHRELYPELNDCDCKQMKTNLRSSASSDWWLGGYRGYICE